MIPMNRLHPLPGGNPITMFQVIDAFTTTGATKDVIVPLGTIVAFSLTYVGTPAATEAPLSIDETVSGTVGGADAAIKGTVGAGSTTVTVTRPAGTTSGAKFSLVVWGY